MKGNEKEKEGKHIEVEESKEYERAKWKIKEEDKRNRFPAWEDPEFQVSARPRLPLSRLTEAQGNRPGTVLMLLFDVALLLAIVFFLMPSSSVQTASASHHNHYQFQQQHRHRYPHFYDYQHHHYYY